MRWSAIWLALVLSSWFLLGCTPNNGTTTNVPLATVSAVDESQPELDHPEYANWSKFPVQSYVIRQRTVTNSNGKVIVTSKIWLESKSEKGVEVGSQVKVERPGERTVDNPSDIVMHAAKFRLPKGMNQDQFYRPSAKAKETGTEKMKVGDLEFEATVYEWEENNEAGPMTVKLWRCDQIPGRIARQEMFTKSSETKTIEELIEVTLNK